MNTRSEETEEKKKNYSHASFQESRKMILQKINLFTFLYSRSTIYFYSKNIEYHIYFEVLHSHSIKFMFNMQVYKVSR